MAKITPVGTPVLSVVAQVAAITPDVATITPQVSQDDTPTWPRW